MSNAKKMAPNNFEGKQFQTEDSQFVSGRHANSVVIYEHQQSPQSSTTNNQFLFQQNKDIPQQKFTLPMAVSSNSIIDLFCNVATKYSFQIIDKDLTTSTAVSKVPFKWKDLLFKCIPLESCKKKNQSTALRIVVGFCEKQCKRTVLVKGLYGNFQTMKSFIKHFSQYLEKQLKFTGKTLKCQLENSFTKQNAQTIYEEEDQDKNTYETSSYYQFHKILSQESYNLGKEVSNFISKFNQQFRSIEESADLIPAPIDTIKVLINETVQTLFSDFNFGKQSTEKMMVYCRPAVERFIFGKLHSKLIAIYKHRYNEDDSEFQKKKKIANEIDIFEHLDLKNEFRLPNLEQPYIEAINELSKLEHL